MRYGIFSDVHSNLEALEAVLQALTNDRVDRLLCAGDLVGYGADPGPCLERIRQAGVVSVCGNHEWAAIGKLPLDWFNEYARTAAEWTSRQLPESQQAYLADFPLVWKGEELTLVHGSLDEPEQFHYVFDPADAQACLHVQQTSVAFIGHTHVPGVYIEEESRVRFLRTNQWRLESGRKALVNVGSVGQPRDGDPRAGYCLYDTQAQIVEIRRVAYPIEQTQAKIRAAGLPEFLADRLAYGY